MRLSSDDPSLTLRRDREHRTETFDRSPNKIHWNSRETYKIWSYCWFLGQLRFPSAFEAVQWAASRRTGTKPLQRNRAAVLCSVWMPRPLGSWCPRVVERGLPANWQPRLFPPVISPSSAPTFPTLRGMMLGLKEFLSNFSSLSLALFFCIFMNSICGDYVNCGWCNVGLIAQQTSRFSPFSIRIILY